MKTPDLKKHWIFKPIRLRYTEDSHIESSLSPVPLSLVFIGFGVFALKEFNVGDFILEYRGI